MKVLKWVIMHTAVLSAADKIGGACGLQLFTNVYPLKRNFAGSPEVQ